MIFLLHREFCKEKREKGSFKKILRHNYVISRDNLSLLGKGNHSRDFRPEHWNLRINRGNQNCANSRFNSGYLKQLIQQGPWKVL